MQIQSENQSSCGMQFQSMSQKDQNNPGFQIESQNSSNNQNIQEGIQFEEEFEEVEHQINTVIKNMSIESIRTKSEGTGKTVEQPEIHNKKWETGVVNMIRMILQVNGKWIQVSKDKKEGCIKIMMKRNGNQLALMFCQHAGPSYYGDFKESNLGVFINLLNKLYTKYEKEGVTITKIGLLGCEVAMWIKQKIQTYVKPKIFTLPFREGSILTISGDNFIYSFKGGEIADKIVKITSYMVQN